MRLKKETCFETFPKRDGVKLFINSVKDYLFPGYYSKRVLFENRQLKKILSLYKKHICKYTGELFVKELPNIKTEVQKDLDFFFESDPASESKDEIVIAYPGFLAIMYYRIAHIIHSLAVPYVPRMITEIAHSKTGIDIHPGCKIGSPFFIDHGTGIVIGETAEIGDHVKLYQGVTIGALSLRDGQALKGKKRHPTILNNVTIYSGASIFGGETIIGNNVILGSNVFITESIPDNTVCRLTPCGMEKREK